ncbi:MAG: hypothetical protein LKH29_02725 [Eggerthellaceae bacterium]|jgi:hypothetical protein|nr:hypothetical protein [Eggerthellaceae bacterium]
MNNKHKNLTMAFALVLALGLPAATLTACGGSSSDTSSSSSSSAAAPSSSSSSSTSTSSSSSSSTSASTTSSSSSSAGTTRSYSIDASSITEAYAGVSEAGEAVYWISNSDSSQVGIFFLDANNAANVSFMGPATMTQQNGENLITVTDQVTGNTLTFGIASNGDGTVTIDMGNELGKAVLAQADVSDTIATIQAIQTYTDSLA